jgi:hypothetical protein
MRLEDVWEAGPGDDPREATRRLGHGAASGKVAQLLRSREMRVLPEPTTHRLQGRVHPLTRMVLALKAAVRRSC